MKQERWFVCSESMLLELGKLRGYDQDLWDLKDLEKAEAACRARPVPEEATHFVKNLEGPLDYGLYSIEEDWEIKK